MGYIDTMCGMYLKEHIHNVVFEQKINITYLCFIIVEPPTQMGLHIFVKFKLLEL